MRLIFLSVLIILSLCATKDNHWAVIVAGSDGYWNYRHQADTCHAYHIMKKNGIPDDHIIHFAKDDIASNSRNPFPGKIYNKPNGQDVYEGCQIDYKGNDVTPEKFLSVLRGEEQPNGGKTLKSGKGDKIFINFSDHGSPGLIAFPSKPLYATDFIETLKFMHEHEMYDEMVIYIEACESGSMFENLLPEDINIYATTAANAIESSWGYYCYPDDVVNGVHIGSCLGDLYSIIWMENSDESQVCTETISEQFDVVKTKTTKSHVMEYGDKSIKSEVVGNFEGSCDAPSIQNKFLNYLSKTVTSIKDQFEREYTAWDSRDVKLHYLYNRYIETKDPIDALELQDEIQHRQLIDYKFERISKSVNLTLKQGLKNHDCYKTLVNLYIDVCGYDEYSLKHFNVLAELCNTNADAPKIIKDMCPSRE